MREHHTDLAIVGSGAAGLFAALWAGREARAHHAALRIVAFDGAAKLGAKILVAGGGRCNVTHDVIDPAAYFGSSANAIRKVLRRFDSEQTIRFFLELGVPLKREETGKLFPVSDDGHDVLGALLRAAQEADVQLLHPRRVTAIARETSTFGGHFIVHHADHPPVSARRVILATGGKSLPKTGSDGLGHELARSLGHTIASPVLPALVPLTLDRAFFLTQLSGITIPATLELRAASGKKLISFTNSTLFTHFGLSGPGPLDISRHLLVQSAPLGGPSRPESPGLYLNILPGQTIETVDTALIELAQKPGKLSLLHLQSHLPPAHMDAQRELRLVGLLEADQPFRPAPPERLLRAVCEHVKLDASMPAGALSRDARRAVAGALTQLRLPVTGDRGYNYAEVTAGGVPLAELHLESMESRIAPGLHFCGELCDVDARIGGYNFQWAWASGFVAGLAAARALMAPGATA